MKLFLGIDELVTLQGAVDKSARRPTEADLSVVEDGAILENRGRVVWAGPRRESARVLKTLTRAKPKTVDLKARCVIPAFVEAHTHMIFAGDRQHEFELRNQGASYQDIAKQGGGIQWTVAQTGRASAQALGALAEARARAFLRQGVTTVEVKSGYGLNEKNEFKILEVAQRLKSVRVVGTYLGPHAIPREQTREKYLQEILTKTLPKLAKKKLAERVDIFIEEGYFSLEDAKVYLQKALDLGFRLTGHADQLTRTGAGRLLADLGADCADHLVQASDEDLQVLSRSETTAVLLPASDFYLKIAYPKARALVESGARVALATDFNPGTAPTQDLSFVGVLARLHMKMTLPEVLTAYTLGAAYAVGRSRDLGSLTVGKFCDFTVLNGSWRELFYQVGHHPVSQVFQEGRLAFKHRFS